MLLCGPLRYLVIAVCVCVRVCVGRMQVHTYAVSEVRDPLTGSELSFSDAVRRGVIDRDTADYVDRHAAPHRVRTVHRY